MTTASKKTGDVAGIAVRLHGALAQTPLAEILRKIAVEERSGDLEISGPSFVKSVYFDRGSVVFASSNRKTDRLGESMIEAGRISRHEFALASMLMKSTKQKFGEVLVEAGIVPEEELGRFVAAQVNRIVLSLFLAKQGTYKFNERPCSIPVELMVSLSVYRILLEGIRRMSRKSLVLAGLPPLDTEVKIVDPPPFNVDVDKLRPEEKSVLRAAKNGATIQDIVNIVDGHEGVILRACYGLVCGGILEPVELDPERRLLQVQEETGTFVLSEIRHKVESPPETTPTPAAPPAEPVAAREPVLAPPKPTSTAFDRPADPPTTPAAPSDGVTLGDLFEWLSGLWQTVLGWFGGGSEPHRERPEPRVPPRKAMPPRSAAPQRAAPAPPPSSTAAPAKVESVGVPPWSVKDDPVATPDEKPAEKSVGTPSWSLKSDAMDPHADEGLGVPAWSAKDPDAATTPTPTLDDDDASVPEPESAIIEPPSWSIKDVPEPPEDEPLDTSQSLDLDETFEPAPGVDASLDEEPLPDLDSELFIEGDVSGDNDLSMLRQIPVEDVELSQDLEIEVDLEIEEEALSQLPETGEMLRQAALPPEPPRAKERDKPVAPPTPPPPPQPASTAAPERKPVAPSAPSRDYEIQEEEASRETSHEQEMRRMKQSGGESRLLRDVKLHFRMRDWKGAVPLLEQLVAISPGKALYRGMLARAMSRSPGTRKDAEEHFVEALRLSPRDPELHYWLGLYYKSFGLSSRAISEFRTTLRINPKHEGARKQLGAGKKDDALGSVFKKLFG